jgi:hypothetical protein
MAAQWRKRAGRVLFPEVLPVCNGRRQACQRPLDGLTITIKGEHTNAITLPFKWAVVYEKFAGRNAPTTPEANWCGW